MPEGRQLLEMYRLLRARFGFLDWWPGDTADEVFIGAILTQQTTWKNVEKAIANLKGAGLLGVASLSRAKTETIAELIRPSGYYRQKALRLREACSWVIENYGSLESLFALDLKPLREVLLGINGIGPETADSIILYAAEKPSFVIDAYTKRITNRVYGVLMGISYDGLKQLFESNLPRKTELFNDYHAQMVELAKMHCKSKPACGGCPLSKICLYAAKAKIQ